MLATHTIEAVSFIENLLCLQIDGHELKIPLEKISNKLLSASEIQRSLFKISPSGYGIHWPLIDEDLSIDSLLKVGDQ